MNFKEALIAHLQGEKVETLAACDRFHDGSPPQQPKWRAFGSYYYGLSLELLSHMASTPATGLEFRLAPRAITVNGLEVPTPESVAPNIDTEYFVPDYFKEGLVDKTLWTDHVLDKRVFERGLVYLNKEDAIARAKAMLLHE